MWTFPTPQSSRTATDGVTAHVQLELTASHLLSGLTIAVEREATLPARRLMRQRLIGHESVRRLARLRNEAARLSRESAELGATASRLMAERSELTVHARPGFADKIAGIDAELADVTSRQARARAAAAAVEPLLEESRRAAVKEFGHENKAISEAMYQHLLPRREPLLEKIRAALWPLLTDLAGLDNALLLSMAGGLCGDGGETVEALANELAAAEVPASAVA